MKRGACKLETHQPMFELEDRWNSPFLKEM
jgi:hypothetical protein